MPPLEATATEVLQLEQTRTIKAPRARVYEAWTNPDVLKLWFGSATSHCPHPILDVRVGGAYRLEFRPVQTAAEEAGNAAQAKPAVAASGVYTRVVPDELLEFTWIPSFMPGEESLVTITFKDAPGGTQITVRHAPFLSETSRDNHGKGWTSGLDRLKTTLEA